MRRNNRDLPSNVALHLTSELWKWRLRRHVGCIRSQVNLGVSNCLDCQAVASARAAFQRVLLRTIAFRIVSSFRIQATSATFGGLPAPRRRS